MNIMQLLNLENEQCMSVELLTKTKTARIHSDEKKFSLYQAVQTCLY